jgi:hypothetical protein
MKEILSYIKDYLKRVNKKLLILCSLQMAILIFLNYHDKLEWRLTTHESLPWPEFSGYFILFETAFVLPYLFCWLIEEKKFFHTKPFTILLVVAPAIFSLKMALPSQFPVSNDVNWNEFWNLVYYWPLRLLIITAVLFLIWRVFDSEQPFYGFTVTSPVSRPVVARGLVGGTQTRLSWKPYFWMLLYMVPLIIAASTQADFLATYPKLKSILNIDAIHLSWFHKLIFELSYGSDFLGIEIFFRGFLILAFVKWVGKDAILPMACFYCAIHFGKPLAECISSYFGGLFLGIIVYNTRSIYGALIIHLGIAWLMEVGGYIGNAVSNPLSP